MNFEKPEKLDFWKNEKNCWRYHHFTIVYQKTQSYEVQLVPEIWSEIEFFAILGHFLPCDLPTYHPKKNKIKKKWKKHLDMS